MRCQIAAALRELGTSIPHLKAQLCFARLNALLLNDAAKSRVTARFRTILIRRRSSRQKASRRIIGNDRASREDRAAASHDSKRGPIHLTVEREANQLRGVGKGIGLANVEQQGARFLDSP